MVYLTQALFIVGWVVFGASPAFATELGWPVYGGDPAGTRYSPAAQITRENVGQLTVAWSYSTRDLATKGDAMRRASFEVTPILVDGRLYICSAFNEVTALDPATGQELWRFDPEIDPSIRYPNSFVCRGVAYWRDPNHRTDLCAARIFLATNDRRLIALDAETGKPCAGFGDNGTVAIVPVPHMFRPGEMQITSAPVVTHGLVLVGSSIDDNQRVDAPRGTVNAYDAVTGALVWTFDPLPRIAAATIISSSNTDMIQAGAANAGRRCP